MEEIKIGKYRHFKGKDVKVVGFAKSSETLEDLVLYEESGTLWARPKKMFLEGVLVDGKQTPRFLFIE